MGSQYNSGRGYPDALFAMAEGFESETGDQFENDERVEVIVKFNGDIESAARELMAEAEVLFKEYAIITIDRENISKLYSYSQIESLELPKNLYIETDFNLNSTCIRAVQGQNSGGLTGVGVIVAVIDYGIDYTHRDFRNEDGTSRILFLWDQTQTGTPPAGFAAGAEYTKAELDRALESENPFSVVPSRDTNGHGTAVAGIAAGNGNESNGENAGAAPRADIIFVKVGTRGFRSFTRNTELMRAVKYVIDKARQLNKPVAINMSFGMNNGSHTGDSLFETYLSDVSTEWKTVIVVPTGNEGAAGHHYTARLEANKTHEAEFFTASGISRFYISMWKNFVDILSVEIVFPDGSSSGIIGIENQIKNIRFGNIMLTVIYSQPSHYSVRQEIYINVQAKGGEISAGLWKVIIRPSLIADGSIEMWLPTVEEVTANTQFTNPTKYLTMTIPSTAQKVITVAGYNDRLGNIAEFSGAGSVCTSLQVPDIAAPAVSILTAKNGGGYDSYSGTSMAAPFVTGAAALMMQWGIVRRNDPFLYGERVKAFLRLGANRKAASLYPQPDFGYGTLCLSNTISFLERYKWGGNSQWLQT
ncbi:MAG: S8 family peptidase [Oscillospiraceae bacterium]|nr:S8 family peptidase [Oscillospiraceae bacterium]